MLPVVIHHNRLTVTMPIIVSDHMHCFMAHGTVHMSFEHVGEWTGNGDMGGYMDGYLTWIDGGRGFDGG